MKGWYVLFLYCLTSFFQSGGWPQLSAFPRCTQESLPNISSYTLHLWLMFGVVFGMVPWLSCFPKSWQGHIPTVIRLCIFFVFTSAVMRTIPFIFDGASIYWIHAAFIVNVIPSHILGSQASTLAKQYFPESKQGFATSVVFMCLYAGPAVIMNLAVPVSGLECQRFPLFIGLLPLGTLIPIMMSCLYLPEPDMENSEEEKISIPTVAETISIDLPLVQHVDAEEYSSPKERMFQVILGLIYGFQSGARMGWIPIIPAILTEFTEYERGVMSALLTYTLMVGCISTGVLLYFDWARERKLLCFLVLTIVQIFTLSIFTMSFGTGFWLNPLINSSYDFLLFDLILFGLSGGNTAPLIFEISKDLTSDTKSTGAILTIFWNASATGILLLTDDFLKDWGGIVLMISTISSALLIALLMVLKRDRKLPRIKSISYGSTL